MWSAAKLSSLFVVFSLEFCSGLLACLTVKFLVRKYGMSERFKQALSILNCLTGGVFFATSVMHLLPEAREKLNEALTRLDETTEYPATEGLMGAGFMLILLLETTAKICCATSGKTNMSRNRYGSRERIRNQIRGSGTVKYKPVPQIDDLEQSGASIRVKEFEDSSWIDDVTYHAYGAVDGSLDLEGQPEQDVVSDAEQETSHYVTKEREFHEGDKSIRRRRRLRADSSDQLNQETSKLRGVVLLIALSIHMVFDGLALGLLSTDTKVWALLLAISVHKVLVFFTIGIQLYEMLSSVKKTIFILIILSLVSPLGIYIGVAVTSDVNNVVNDVITGVLEAVATGTFIYVTFFEILSREFNEKQQQSFLKVLVTMLGFGIVAAVRLMEDGEEEILSTVTAAPVINTTE